MAPPIILLSVSCQSDNCDPPIIFSPSAVVQSDFLHVYVHAIWRPWCGQGNLAHVAPLSLKIVPLNFHIRKGPAGFDERNYADSYVDQDTRYV